MSNPLIREVHSVDVRSVWDFLNKPPGNSPMPFARREQDMVKAVVYLHPFALGLSFMQLHEYMEEMSGVVRFSGRKDFDLNWELADYTDRISPIYDDAPLTYKLNSIDVDFGKPSSEFSEEQQEVIDRLRSNGRPVLSEKLVTMLRDVQEDHDGPHVNIVSLRQMALLFIERQNFSDPFIGPDSHGIVYAQWRIVGNGVLIIRFLGYEEVLLVAQADKTPDCEELDIIIQRPKSEVLEEYGHLVPCRH